ncbi:MAG: formate dehydrogenase accessory protein FdhE [Deltaproteobacteria bacterium]|nr:formate dehydrogenase accessory protein FdhE [Deltaproteobacteria bacterium]
MTQDPAVTSDHVKKAAETLKNLRPAYKPILEFYEQIFVAQEDAKNRIQIDPIQISENLLSLKAEENLPLISMSEFVIDPQSAEELLVKICHIADGANEAMTNFAKVLMKAHQDKKLDVNLLFSGLLEENDAYFSRVAEESGANKEILAFLIYNSIQPSLALCAEQLSTYLPENIPWEKGYCPICGAYPGLSMLAGEGERFLFCGFCWHKWEAKRIFCPFCEETDNKTLQYFYSEEEKELRVDVCDSCKKYIKTIDARKAERDIYPPLEQISTLHLDMQAREKGLESGAHLSLQA